MRKVLVVLFCVAGLTMSQTAAASTISLGLGAGGTLGDHIIGEVFQVNDLTGGQAVRDAAAINALLAVALGTRVCADGTAPPCGTTKDPEYYRSTTNFGTLPAAMTANAALSGPIADGGAAGAQVMINLAQAYTYLIVSYDGNNAGAMVYYIGDIAAGNTLSLFKFAQPSDDGNPNWGHLSNDGRQTQYKMTHWTMVNPTSVPDGGTTASLIGLTMVGLGLLRRRLN